MLETMLPLQSGPVTQYPGEEMTPEVIEVALLLPASRAAALLNLAHKRRTSVNHILRQWIDEGLNASL